MKASEFDRTFDAGADVSGQVDWSNAKRPNEQAKRVNVDFPAWVVAGLDRQARHLGVTRQRSSSCGSLNGCSEAATEPEGELGPSVLMPLTSSGLIRHGMRPHTNAPDRRNAGVWL